MAFRAKLVTPTHSIWGPVTLTQTGAEMIRKQAGNESVQSFETELKAKQHLLAHIERLQKRGYIVESVEEIEDRRVQRPEPRSSRGVTLKKSGRRATVTIETKQNSTKLEKLLAELHSLKPKTVHLVCNGASPGAAWKSAIEGKTFSSVTHLVFDSPSVTQTRQGKNSLGDLRATLDAMPALEHAFVTGKSTLSKCEHRTLVSLTLVGDPLSAGILKNLGDCEFPALAKLCVSVASDATPPRKSSLERAVCDVARKSLTELCVEGVEDITSMLVALIDANRVQALRVLELNGRITDEDALVEVLETRGADLAGIERVHLPIEDYLSGPSCERIKKVLPMLSSATPLFLPAAYAAW